jgi:C4-dicarboxylate-specific signal transduction histidine kinase
VYAAGTLLRTARNVAGKEKVPAQVTQCLEQLEGYITHLGEQLDAMEPLYTESQTGNRERLDVLSAVQHVATILAFRFHQAGVRLSLETRAPVTVSMARVHLIQVLLHLFDNALYWLTRAPRDQQREIRVRFLAGQPGLIFADNGPGVRAALREHIFQPFFTGRSDGRGLGLYVVKALLDKYGFPIELLAEPQLLAGANFRIVFGKAASQDRKR